MDGLNLAKELRVFNKSYPTKAPPAEGEAAVRKFENVVSFMSYQKLPTVATNSTHQVLLPNHGSLGNIDQQEMIEADKSEKMHTSFKFQLYMYMSSTQGGVPNATDGQQIPLQGINDYTGMILKVRDDNIDRKESSKIMI